MRVSQNVSICWEINFYDGSICYDKEKNEFPQNTSTRAFSEAGKVKNDFRKF